MHDSLVILLALVGLAACSAGDGPGDDSSLAEVNGEADTDAAADEADGGRDTDAPDSAAIDVSDAPDAANVDTTDLSSDIEDTEGDARDGGDTPSPDADTEDVVQDIEPDTDTGPEVWFELGIGEDDFALAIDGQDAMMAQGIQGGFHVWGAFRAAGFDPNGLTFESTVRDAGGALVGAVYWEREIEADEDGIVEAVGITVFLGPEVIPELEDESVWEYCGTLQSSDGVVGSDCVTIVARCCEYLDF